MFLVANVLAFGLRFGFGVRSMGSFIDSNSSSVVHINSANLHSSIIYCSGLS